MPAEPFRTATGQTGRDAYVNEACAIANAQHRLNARTARLTVAMTREMNDCPARRMAVAVGEHASAVGLISDALRDS